MCGWQKLMTRKATRLWDALRGNDFELTFEDDDGDEDGDGAAQATHRITRLTMLCRGHRLYLTGGKSSAGPSGSSSRT